MIFLAVLLLDRYAFESKSREIFVSNVQQVTLQVENLCWLYVGVAVEGNGTRSAQKCGPGGKRRVENCGQILSQAG